MKNETKTKIAGLASLALVVVALFASSSIGVFALIGGMLGMMILFAYIMYLNFTDGWDNPEGDKAHFDEKDKTMPW